MSSSRIYSQLVMIHVQSSEQNESIFIVIYIYKHYVYPFLYKFIHSFLQFILSNEVQ